MKRIIDNGKKIVLGAKLLPLKGIDRFSGGYSLRRYK